MNFTLTTVGTYTLTMIDTVQNQVISRERFTGKVGLNSLKIYTNSLPTKYLNVVLKDKNNVQNQINKLMQQTKDLDLTLKEKEGNLIDVSMI